MLVMIDENGVADVYDDTYDIVIHCENEEDQKDARLALKDVRRWVPVTERLPELGEYVLISFSNFTLPCIGRYDENEKGGAWFNGDETESLVSQDMYVNAWMPLPEPYRGGCEMIRLLIGFWLVVMAIGSAMSVIIAGDDEDLKTAVIFWVTLGLTVAMAEFGFWLMISG